MKTSQTRGGPKLTRNYCKIHPQNCCAIHLVHGQSLVPLRMCESLWVVGEKMNPTHPMYVFDVFLNKQEGYMVDVGYFAC